MNKNRLRQLQNESKRKGKTSILGVAILCIMTVTILGYVLVDNIHAYAESSLVASRKVTLIHKTPWNTYVSEVYPFWDLKTGTVN